MVIAVNIARKNEDLKRGYRITVNEWEWAGQTVDRFNIQIFQM